MPLYAMFGVTYCTANFLKSLLFTSLQAMFTRVNCGLLSKAVKTKWAELLTHVQEAAPSSTRGHGCFPSTAGLHLQIMCNLYQKIS